MQAARAKPRLLLLAASAEEDRAGRIAAALADAWSVMRPPPDAQPEALTRLAGTAELVLHLDAGAAAWRPPATVPEVYAPARFGAAGVRDAAVFARRFAAERQLAARARLLIAPGRGACDAFALLHGLPPSRLRFGPDAMLATLLALARDRAGRGDDATPVLLAFNDAAVAGHRAGGAERVREVLRALARPTVLIVLGEAGEMCLAAPGILQVTVPKTPLHQAEEVQAARLTGYALGDVLAAAHCLLNPALTAVTAALAARAEAALFSHCYMAPLLEILAQRVPGLPVIYESHNVEHSLKAQLLARHPDGANLVAYVGDIENRLVQAADLVTCCTAADAAAFAPAAREVLLLEHGAPPPARPVTDAAALPRPLRVGFLGSAHPPNVAAARFIVDRLAGACPTLMFEIVGSVCAAIGPVAAPNVILHGEVDEAGLDAILGGWFVALNPLAAGGGASVKLARYCSAGLPVLATPCGARGFDLAAGGAGWVADPAAFGERLAALRRVPSVRDAAARAARDLASGRDWRRTADAARRAVARLAGSPALPAAAPVAVSREAGLLADTLARAGDARGRAVLSRLLPDGPFTAVVCRGEAPLVRARARDMAHRLGHAVVFGCEGMLWVMPPTGRSRRATASVEQALIAGAGQCVGLLAPGADGEGQRCALLASALGIPIRSPRLPASEARSIGYQAGGVG